VKLTDSKIARQVLFVNATKETEEVTDQSPHAFHSVDMNFADAVAIVIPGPLFESMTNRGVRTLKMVVTLPFIGVDKAVLLGKVLDMSA
jgi:hypothetical protein